MQVNTGMYHKIFLMLGGSEIARVDFHNNTIMVKGRKKLQFKGYENYYIEGLKLKPEEIYTSPIRLSREEGKIEIPHTPVVNFSMKIVDKHHKDIVGVLVATMQIPSLEENIGTGDEQAYIATTDGHYLYNPDSKKNYGFDLDTKANIYDDFPKITSLIYDEQPYSAVTENGLVSARLINIDPNTPNRHLIILKVQPLADVIPLWVSIFN